MQQRSDNQAARRMIVSSDAARPGERLDLAVHALAQLPRDVVLELRVDAERARALFTLANAYGVADQIEASDGGADGTVLYTSPANFHGTRARLPGPPPASILVDEDGPSEPRGEAPGLRTVRSLGELVESLFDEADAPAPCRADVGLLEGQRIALITNNPNHYRIPLWNDLARLLESADGQLRVFFAGGDPTRARPWLKHAPIEFDHLRLRTRSLGVAEIPVDLERRLRDFRPTQVISGGFGPAVSGRAAHFARRQGLPFGLWSGDTAVRARQRGRWRYFERARIARMSNFAIAYSWRAAEYLRGLAPELPTVIVRNTTAYPAEVERDERAEEVQFLSVARAIPGKGLELAVDAFRLAGDLPCRLTMVGDGPELPGLRKRARDCPRIEFVGSVPSDRVLSCFAAADAFVFPSEIDVFGLALVEAMGSGLPTITSDVPGAAGDLAVDGLNALVLNESGADRWAEAIRALVQDPQLRGRLGRNARRTVDRRWTLEHSVDAWVAGLSLGAIAGGR